MTISIAGDLYQWLQAVASNPARKQVQALFGSFCLPTTSWLPHSEHLLIFIREAFIMTQSDPRPNSNTTSAGQPLDKVAKSRREFLATASAVSALSLMGGSFGARTISVSASTNGDSSELSCERTGVAITLPSPPRESVARM